VKTAPGWEQKPRARRLVMPAAATTGLATSYLMNGAGVGDHQSRMNGGEPSKAGDRMARRQRLDIPCPEGESAKP